MEIDIVASDSVTHSETPGETAPSPDGLPEGESAAPAAPEKIRLGPGEQRSDAELQRELSVLLFASREPLTAARLVELLERPHPARVTAALERLQAELEAGAATLPVPLVLRKIAGA